MVTLGQCLLSLRKRLNDISAEIWTDAQLIDYIGDGYYAITRDVPCLFSMAMWTNEPQSANHTREFEEQFMTGPILSTFNFTKEDDRIGVDPRSSGPVNNTRPSDAVATAASSPAPTTSSTRRLPEGVVEIDRVSHNFIRLMPQPAQYLRSTRWKYETMQGGTFMYTMDQDGFRTLRLVAVPAGVPATYTTSGVFGVLRSQDFWNANTDGGPIEDTTVVGSYGIMRSMSRHFNQGQYGAIRRVVPDNYATRVEYFRLGERMTGSQDTFSIPDRVVKYTQWWAMFRAYSHPGKGEDAKLAEHYKQRYTMAADRLQHRVNAEQDGRTKTMGMQRTGVTDSYLSLFPPDYGYGRRFGG